jgi:hypothetical protein
MSQFNGYQSSTQPTRRYKRSKRTQVNSGQRSQYNPNPKRPLDYEDIYNEDKRNSSNSTKEMEIIACALHCFMEQLDMVVNN